MGKKWLITIYLIFKLILLINTNVGLAISNNQVPVEAGVEEYKTALLKLSDRLATLQNEDGGWPYVVGEEKSVPEITGSAGLALAYAYRVKQKEAYMGKFIKSTLYAKEKPAAFDCLVVTDSIRGVTGDTVLLGIQEHKLRNKQTLLESAKKRIDDMLKAYDYNAAEILECEIRLHVKDVEGPYRGMVYMHAASLVEGLMALASHYQAQRYEKLAKDIADLVYRDLKSTPYDFNYLDLNTYGLAEGVIGAVLIFSITKTHASFSEELLEILTQIQKEDGSFTVKARVSESTTYKELTSVLLTAYGARALLTSDEKAHIFAAKRALRWILNEQRENGGLGEVKGDESPAVEGAAARAFIDSILKFAPRELNIPPLIVRIDVNITRGYAPLDVEFYLAGAIDLDSNFMSVLWDFGDGHSSVERRAKHTYTQPGVYIARLILTDAEGKHTTKSVKIEVLEKKGEKRKIQLPEAHIVALPLTGPAPLTVRFDASKSTAYGKIVEYSWDFGDGSRGSGVKTQHTYPEKGTYTVKLVVTDDRGKKRENVVKIVVTETQAPIDSRTMLIGLIIFTALIIIPLGRRYYIRWRRRWY
jgi:hypothetical protein